MLVLNSACLLLTEEVLLELEDIVLTFILNLKAFWDGHAELALHICLSVGQHKINLLGEPPMNQCSDEHHSDGCPWCHRWEGLPVVNSFLLLGAINVEPCLPFVYLPGCNSALALHGPHCWKNLGSWRDRWPWYQLPNFIFSVTLDLLLHRHDEFGAIRLPHGLMVVHCVGIRGGGESQHVMLLSLNVHPLFDCFKGHIIRKLVLQLGFKQTDGRIGRVWSTTVDAITVAFLLRLSELPGDAVKFGSHSLGMMRKHAQEIHMHPPTFQFGVIWMMLDNMWLWIGTACHSREGSVHESGRRTGRPFFHVQYCRVHEHLAKFQLPLEIWRTDS